MKAQTRLYGNGSETFEGYLAYPASDAPAPCVLIAHDWRGPNPMTFAIADQLAKQGYVAFAIDLYGKGTRGQTSEECAALMTPLVQDRNLILQRFSLALEVARKDPRINRNAIAAIGHCFGGLCVLDMARHNAGLRGVVSVHGVLSPPPQATAQTIDTRILVLHGNEDPLAPPEDVAALYRELSKARADWQCHVFGATMHAFTVPEANDPENGLRYSSSAARRSQQLIDAFLEEVLR